MIQANATTMPRWFSGVCLAIVAVFVSTSGSISAQTTPAPAADKKPPVSEPKTDVPDASTSADVFVDPNAKKALTIFNPLNFVGAAMKVGGAGDDRARVQSMASRATNVDPDFLKRFIEFFAVELTRRDNLNAVLNPPANLKYSDAPSRALERAVDALNKPIIDAKANDNKEFLSLYSRLLFESSLPKLLENNHNYLTRLDAMIVLGMAGNPSPAALDLYVAQLKKPDQLLWVRLWAARGLTIASQSGAIDLDASRANQATEAIMALLEADPKMPWPAQMRLVEAMGSLRVSTANTVRGKIDSGSLALKIMADQDESSIVRAWAAWSLGFMKAPSGGSTYNYALIGHELGELVVDLGNQIVEEYDDDPAKFDKEKDEATQLASLLIFQVYPAVIGQEGVRDSGLLQNKAAAVVKPFLSKLDEKIKAVTRGAYELIRAAGGGNKSARNELDAKLADLKSFLATSSPKDRRLIAGGPEFPTHPGQ